MLAKLLIVWLMMVLCVAVHAGGVAAALRWVRHRPSSSQNFWPWTWLFIRLAGWMILFHLIEISAWACCYVWLGAVPDLPTAIYFSAVTYTTAGYGDLVLPEPWRLVGGVEALTGILMCGWSPGFFFAVVNQMCEQPALAPPEKISS